MLVKGRVESTIFCVVITEVSRPCGRGLTQSAVCQLKLCLTDVTETVQRSNNKGSEREGGREGPAPPRLCRRKPPVPDLLELVVGAKQSSLFIVGWISVMSLWPSSVGGSGSPVPGPPWASTPAACRVVASQLGVAGRGGRVLSVLLVLGVEVVDGVVHDVFGVHRLLHNGTGALMGTCNRVGRRWRVGK